MKKKVSVLFLFAMGLSAQEQGVVCGGRGPQAEMDEVTRIQVMHALHLLPFHDPESTDPTKALLTLLRAAPSTTATTSPILNQYGTSIAFGGYFAGHPDSETVIFAGNSYRYNPSSSSGSTTSNTVQTAYSMLSMARYNYTTGQIDTTFNPNKIGINGVVGTGKQGQVITNFGTNVFVTQAIVHTIDRLFQLIVVVGYVWVAPDNTADTKYQMFIARYNWNGTLDKTFNPNGPMPGVVMTPISVFPGGKKPISGVVDQALAVTNYFPDMYVVVGEATGQLFVARYFFDGSLDFTFNSAGAIYDFTTPTPTFQKGQVTPGIFLCNILGQRTLSNNSIAVVGYDRAYGVGTYLRFPIQSQIWVVGTGAGLTSANPYLLGPNQIILLRLTSDGIPDVTFGRPNKALLGGTLATGVQVTNVQGFNDSAYQLAVQDDFQVVVAGSSSDVFGNYSLVLARYNLFGVLDPTFGDVGKFAQGPSGRIPLDGITLLPVSESIFSVATRVKLQPDGKILLGGFNTYNVGIQRFTFTAARFNADGSLDRTFNSGGIPQGILGYNTPAPNQPGVQTVAFSTTYKLNGQTITVPGLYDKANDIALQPNGTGKTFLLGSSYQNNPSDQYYAFAVARLFPTGLIDKTFTTTFTFSTT